MPFLPPNIFVDAPVFNWDVCPSCGYQGGGGSTGAGGRGGNTGSSSRGGSGGNMGNGGTGGAGTGPTTDAGIILPPDAAGADASVSLETGSLTDVRPQPDQAFEVPSNTGGADADTGVPPAACEAKIVSVWPADLSEGGVLVAAPNIKVVLRAQIVSGTAPTNATWVWQGKWYDSQLAAPEIKSEDPSAAAFLVEREGSYSFTATLGTCMATLSRAARGPGRSDDSDNGIHVQIVSPPSYDLATQDNFFSYSDSIRLAESRVVSLFASAGSSRVPAYIRIGNQDGSLATDGFVAASADFRRPLNVLAGQGALARYSVLVVPLDGAGDGTLAASAPKLFANRVVADLEQEPRLDVSGGLAVTGTLNDAGGTGAAGARIMLSNQNPNALAAPANLVFSSAGQSDAQGRYVLRAQPGLYWATISPAPGAGLLEAVSATTIDLGADATADFAWSSLGTAGLTLQVFDGRGIPAPGVRVLVTSAEPMPVGTLTFRTGSSSPLTISAIGSFRLEARSDSQTGVVTFPSVPTNASYRVILVPPALGPFAATTEITLAVPAAGLVRSVALLPEAKILGRLVTGAAAADFSKIAVVAFDKSRLFPEAPRAATVNSDGSFALGVSPGRSYAVIVQPDPSSGLARTFVGPGLLQGSVFEITQKVQATKDWTATVSVTRKTTAEPIVGAALRATCQPGYWRCIDPTIPLAETTSGEGGAFVLKVPDPATR